jgi:hypothetical protein
MPKLYASLPLTGPARHLGREVLLGAELALEPVRGRARPLFPPSTRR